MARLPDPVPDLTGEDRRIYDTMLADRRRHGVGLYGPYVPLLHHPHLAERIEALGSYLKFDGRLPRDRYQFVVLAFARAIGATFEWEDHVEHALAAGVSQAAVDALRDAGDVPAPYADLDRAVASTLGYADLPGDVQDRIVADVGTAGLVEVVVLCGFYALIAMVNGAFDVPLSDVGGGASAT